MICRGGSLVTSFDASLVGANLRAGVSAKVAPAIQAGLSIETPTFYNVREDFSTFLETAYDLGDRFTYGDLEGDLGNGSFEYQITTPWRLGGGFSYSTPRANVAAEIEYVDWSQMRLRVDSESDDEGYFDEENVFTRTNYDAKFNARLGGEVWLGSVALRAGIGLQPDPRKYAEVKSDRTFLSAGLGYRLAEQLQIDFGFAQERFDDQYMPYALSDEYRETFDVGAAPLVEETVRRNRFVIGLRYMF